MKRLRNSILVQALNLRDGGSPEKLIQELAGQTSRKYSPEQIRDTMTLLHRLNPEAASGLRAAVLDEMTSAAEIAGEEGLFSPKKLATMLSKRKNRAKLDALFVGDPQGRAAVEDVLEVNKILGDAPALGGSQTALKQIMWAMLSAPLAPFKAAKMFGTLTLAEGLTKAMVDPRYADEVLRLTKANPGAPEVVADYATRVALRAAGIEGREQARERLR